MARGCCVLLEFAPIYASLSAFHLCSSICLASERDTASVRLFVRVCVFVSRNEQIDGMKERTIVSAIMKANKSLGRKRSRRKEIVGCKYVVDCGPLSRYVLWSINFVAYDVKHSFSFM